MAPEASARTETGCGGEHAQRLFSRCSAWARVQRQNKPSQVDRPVPRPGVCQGGYPQSPDAPGGTEVLWGRRGAGGGDKEVQARGPKERNKAATCGCREGGSAQPGSHPRETPVPSGLRPPCGRAHWQAPGAQPDKTSSKWTEMLDSRPSLGQPGPCPSTEPEAGLTGPKAARRGCCASAGGTCGCLSQQGLSPPRQPPPRPKSPWEDQPGPLAAQKSPSKRSWKGWPPGASRLRGARIFCPSGWEPKKHRVPGWFCLEYQYG